MSSLSHLYTDLDHLVLRGALADGIGKQVLEDAELNGFEAGYQAGWEDAGKATDSESARLTSELVNRFQDLSFTYQEAFAKMGVLNKPLLTKIIHIFYSNQLDKSLECHIVDEIECAIKNSSELSFEILVPKGVRELLSKTLGSNFSHPFSIIEDETLGVDRIFMRINEREREIDIGKSVEQLNIALDSLFSRTEIEVRHA